MPEKFENAAFILKTNTKLEKLENAEIVCNFGLCLKKIRARKSFDFHRVLIFEKLLTIFKQQQQQFIDTPLMGLFSDNTR